MRRLNAGAVIWPLVLIAVGVLMLLQNFGLISPKVWGAFWAVVLMALGVWTLMGVLVPRRTEAEQASAALEGAARARIRLDHGAGRLNVKAGSDPAQLFSGTFQGGLDYRIDRDGDEARARLNTPPGAFPFWNWGPGAGYDWAVELNPAIPLRLELRAGADEARLDLSALRVTELRIDTGASSTEVVLPASAGFTSVRVSAGAASLALRVPPGVAARVRARGGAMSAEVDTGRFPRAGDVYQSPDYDTAANKIEIDANLGAGSLEVR